MIVLAFFQEHESKCSFVGVKCTNKDCEATPLKKDLNYHATKECPKRNVECHYCKIFFVWCNKQVNIKNNIFVLFYFLVVNFFPITKGSWYIYGEVKEIDSVSTIICYTKCL